MPYVRGPARLCKCGCGRPAKEYYYQGHFKGYLKFADGCKVRWTEDSRERYMVGIRKAALLREVPDYTRRIRTCGGRSYWIIKLPLSDARETGCNGTKHWIYEHRYIAEHSLGRQLKREEQVHHLNGDSLDNRPENLMVLGHGEHTRVTIMQQSGKPLTKPHTCPCCGLWHKPPP